MAVQARYRAGEVPQLEVLRAEVEESRAQREVEIAQNRLRQAEGRLNILLGREAQAPTAIRELAAPTSEQLPPLAPLVAKGIAERVELKQAETAIAREALQRRLAQAGLWTGTQVALSAGSASGQAAIAGSLTIPMPFYRRQGELAEAEANRMRAEARRDALRNEITLEIEQAYRDAAIAAHQTLLFAKTYVPQAERLLDNAQRRFQVGEGSGLEVVEARRALRETRTEYQQSLLSYRQALSRLERATGTDLSL
jgi:cobalt-zinc-cadmium efflux system outer membrane protein